MANNKRAAGTVDDVVAAALVGTAASLAVFAVEFAALDLMLDRTESMEALAWAGSFAVSVPVGVLVARWLLRGRYPHAALAQSTGPLVAVTGFVLLVGRSFSTHLPIGGAFLIAVAPPLGLILQRRAHVVAWLQRSPLRPWDQGLMVAAGGVCGLIAFLPEGSLPAGRLAASLVIVAYALVVHRAVSGILVNRRLRLALAIVAATAIALWVWDVGYRPNPFDQNFYLGPANDVRHGRYMLVDVYSQYGVGVLYALSAALRFLRFGYGSMMLLVGFLTAVGAAATYAVLRISTRSLAWSTAGAFVAGVAGPYATIGRSVQYASTGFLRFGMTWLLVLALVLAYRTDRLRWRSMGLACALLGVSAIWSFEAAFYSTGTFVTVVVVAAFCERRLRSAAAPLAAGAAAMVISVSGLCVATQLGRGEMPNPGGYLEFIRLYSSTGFGTLLVDNWSLGYLIMAAYVASFIVIGAGVLYAPGSHLARLSTVVPLVAVTAFGGLSYTYFLGRSHPNNLTHIAPPVVVMVTMWAALAARRWITHRTPLYGAAALLALWAGALLTVGQWSVLSEKSHDSALSAVLSPFTASPSLLHQARVLRSNPPVAPAAQVLEQLIRGSVPEDAPLLILTDPPLLTESLLRLNRSNVLPISTPGQDGLVPSQRDRTITAAAHIPCGTYVVTQDAPFTTEVSGAVDTILLDGVLNSVRSTFTLDPVADADAFHVLRVRCSDG